MKRGNGVLAHIASLPSDSGIGNLGAAAFRFIDRLKASRQTYWQVMPCLTGAQNDPYNMLSAFAGNADLIDMAALLDQGFLQPEDYSADGRDQASRIDYKRVAAINGRLLEAAYNTSKDNHLKEFNDFKYNNAYWLFDYALYTAIRSDQGDRPPEGWLTQLLHRDPEAVMKFAESHAQEIERIQFSQFLFFKQLEKLKEYAEQNDITLIGELPFYINGNCADVWAQPDLIIKDNRRVCPSRKGGALNIPYNWEYCKRNNYRWWMARIAHWLNYFHCLKIDRLGDVYCTVISAEGGVTGTCDDDHPNLEYGPGYDFNNTLRRHMPAANIIAGAPNGLAQKGFLLNCGYITVSVIQDAFGTEGAQYLPYNMNRNSGYQTSRYDESSCRSWFLQSSDEVKQRLLHYFGPFGPYSFYASFDEDNVTVKLMRAAMGSVADVCIVPMADVLNLTDAEKLYSPDKHDNWVWRLQEKDLYGPQMERLKQMTITYGRS